MANQAVDQRNHRTGIGKVSVSFNRNEGLKQAIGGLYMFMPLQDGSVMIQRKGQDFAFSVVKLAEGGVK